MFTLGAASLARFRSRASVVKTAAGGKGVAKPYCTLLDTDSLSLRNSRTLRKPPVACIRTPVPTAGVSTTVEGGIMKDSFDSEELILLTRVIDKACLELGGCDEATLADIASRVMAYYSDHGELDFNALLSIATGGRMRETSHAR
jgi:hypothetical protein